MAEEFSERLDMQLHPIQLLLLFLFALVLSREEYEDTIRTGLGPAIGSGSSRCSCLFLSTLPFTSIALISALLAPFPSWYVTNEVRSSTTCCEYAAIFLYPIDPRDYPLQSRRRCEKFRAPTSVPVANALQRAL
jgi:hypothetical protein